MSREALLLKVERQLNKISVLLLNRQDRLLNLEEYLLKFDRTVKIMSQAVDELKAAVERQRTISASVVELVNGLRAQLQAAIDNGDLGEVQKLVDELEVEQDNLAAAIATNTPAPSPDPAPAGPT